jgi:hypothetical protein
MFIDFSKTLFAQILSSYYLTKGISSYSEEFLAPLFSATQNFTDLESTRIFSRDPMDNLLA